MTLTFFNILGNIPVLIERLNKYIIIWLIDGIILRNKD